MFCHLPGFHVSGLAHEELEQLPTETRLQRRSRLIELHRRGILATDAGGAQVPEHKLRQLVACRLEARLCRAQQLDQFRSKQKL